MKSTINILVFIIIVIIKYDKGTFGHTTKPESRTGSRKLEGCVEAEIKLDDGVMESGYKSKWLRLGILMSAEKEKSRLKAQWE